MSSSIKDYFPKDGKAQGLYCNECKKPMVLIFDDFVDVVSGIHMTINDFPHLFCPICEIKYLPDRSNFYVIHLHAQASSRGEATFFSNRQKIKENFVLTNIPFLYDADDYYCIPGLRRAGDDGFLTPVFFNKSVLVKFQARNNYRISFASKTYGHIYSTTDDDFDIDFGINRSGNVIMWLGDISELPKNEQYYLLSENIESNHDVGSEFYDGQIECIFTEPSPENKLILKRSDFLEACLGNFGDEISSLKEETLDSISKFNPPILFTDSEQTNTIDLLNKINIESLNRKVLARLLKKLNGEPADLGSLNILQQIFTISFPEADIRSMFTSLFVLNAYRVNTLHQKTFEQRQQIMREICQNLEIPEDSSFETIYPVLLDKLIKSYEDLTVLIGNLATQ